MYSGSVILSLRAAVVALMALVLMVSPMDVAADSAQISDTDGPLCVHAEPSDEAPANGPSKESVDHRAHHCGCCHMARRAEPTQTLALAMQQRPIPEQTVHGGLDSEVPYRPPRT